MEISYNRNDVNSVPTSSGVKKLYTKPAIIHELMLETRAGSPLGPIGLDPIDDVTGIWGTGTDK